MPMVPKHNVSDYCNKVINLLYQLKSTDHEIFNLYIHFLANIYSEFSCLIGNSIIVDQIYSIQTLPQEQIHKALLFNMYQFHITFTEYHNIFFNLIINNTIDFDTIENLSEYKKNLMYCFCINRLLFSIRKYLNNDFIKNKIVDIFDNEFAKNKIDSTIFSNKLEYIVHNIDDHETFLFLFNSLQKLVDEYNIILV